MAGRHRGTDTGSRARRPNHVRADRRDASFEPWLCSGVQIHRARNIIGATQAEEEPMTVFVYVNTSKQIGDKDHVKVFANVDVAEKWFEANDPEGVAFEYEVLE